MPTLQVRELPEQIYQKLKEEARKQHRSLAQQAIMAMAKGLDVSLKPAERRKEVIASLRKKTAEINHYKLSDPVTMLREDRER